MAAINFPDSPSNGDTHVVDGVTYTYNSAETKWKTTINSNAFLPLSGGTVSGNLSVSGDVTVDTNTLYVDSTNNRVGIGVTSPGDNLEIAHADNEGLTFKATGTDGTTATQITYEDTNGGVGGVLQFDHANNSFSFETAGSERARILSGGGLTFNGDTAAANALDDYEEGTWVPQFSTTNNDWSSTANSQSGVYTKIGRMVHISFRLQESRSAGTGALQITNFPFDLSTSDKYVLALNPAFGGWGSTNAPRGGFGTSGTTVLLKKADGSDARSILDTSIDASAVSNPGLIGSMTYYIS